MRPPTTVSTYCAIVRLTTHGPTPQYRDWQPLREADLQQVTALGERRDALLHAGWFMELGSGEVLTASLTMGGRIMLAVAESTTQSVLGCRSAFSIATLDPQAGPVRFDARGGWRDALPEALPTAATFTLTTIADANTARAICTLGGTHIAGCDVDTRPRRTWWRRMDAE